MRRVLFLAQQFPPIGFATGRTVACARYLAHHGYEVTVVTGPGESTSRWAQPDPALMSRIADVDVRRVPGTMPRDRRGVRARVARWTEQPPRWVNWWVQSARETAAAVEGRFDVILANLIPYETAFAAAKLSRELGIPWVADLEDPWALDEMRVAPTALNHRIDRARMLYGLETASAVIMNCREAADSLRAEMPGLGKIVAGIPHGFTDEDFDAPAPRRSDGAFRIVHTGSLHTQLGLDHRRSARRRRLLGGTSVDVDILTRSHLYLMNGIDALRAADPRAEARVELHLAGHLTDADRRLIDGRDYVKAYGQLSHADTIALARSADMLFVPMHDMPEGRRARLVPCKTYEYLAAERPILGALPDGDARDLVSQFRRAHVVRPSDSAGMARAIYDRLTDPHRGLGEQGRAAEPLRRYERRYLTGEIAEVLDQVVGHRRLRVARVAA